jgi:alpha-soluble NSF attachment protein
MSDQIARGEEFEKKAEKKLSGWGLFSSKYEDAADLFDKAANSFKLAKSWDKAGSTYIKLANCHLKMDSKHEAASAYANASNCYKKTNSKESISCLEQAVNLFLEDGKFNMSARYYKEIAELYEADHDFEKAIVYYERATDLFQSEEVTTSANQCRQKIAQFAAQLEDYQKSIEIYEDIARQWLNNNLLKYGVRGHLLNAGLCQLCKGKGDVVAINNALERYQDLDPTFSGTREYKLLADLADAIDQEDVAKFTDAVKEFDSMTQLDAWKTTLLLRVKEALKAKELEDDDLT